MSNSREVLFLTGEQWYDDYSAKKFRFIHLTLSYMNISTTDLFMLAASRIYPQGEFIIRVDDVNNESDILDKASAFDFSIIANNHSTGSLGQQYTFRFNGQETRKGYELAQARFFTDGCMDLFKKVFESTISKKFWLWKYPSDQEPRSVIALKHNQVVAHYGFCDRFAVYNNNEIDTTQACDVMVAPGDRGAISSSVFYELVKIEEKLLQSENSTISFVYGFPHGRSYKLGARLKLYNPISPIWEVAFSIAQKSTTHSGKIDKAELILVSPDRKDDINATLTLMFAAQDTLILKRDYHYLLQRYVHHPEYQYEIYRFKECYFIIKPLKDRVLLMDYFGKLENYAQNLAAFIAYLTNIYPGMSLHLWCLEDMCDVFSNAKSIVNTGAFFVNKQYSSNLPNFKSWWITMGDTEFL